MIRARDHLLCGVSQMTSRLSFSGLYFVLCRLLRYQLRWALRFSSLIVAAHHSPHGLCALTLLSCGDLKACKTRLKARISRRRQRDPNYCNTLTYTVIPSLSRKDKKTDSPEPKCIFPAVPGLQQRCGCVCLQLNNTPEDSSVFNTTKYQHNQCLSPLALRKFLQSLLWFPNFQCGQLLRVSALTKQVSKLLILCPFCCFFFRFEHAQGIVWPGKFN